MRLLKDEIKETPEGPISDVAVREAASLFINLIVKGYQPEDIIAILSDALARATTLFSPDLETALKNHAGNALSIEECVKANWPHRKELEEQTERRVAAMLPVRELFQRVMGRPYFNSPEPTKEDEIAHT